MRKATATYHAPEGDSKEVEMGGVLFKDGEPVEINSDEHGHLVNKLPGNPHFEVKVGDDDGKPVNVSNQRDLSAGIDEARDHDFEDDRRARRGRPPKTPAAE